MNGSHPLPARPPRRPDPAAWYARSFARARAAAPPTLASDRYRRVAGLVLGAMAGVALAAVSQAINPLSLPGVPLYQPPFGAFGNAALLAGGGILVGLGTAWSDRTVTGLLAGCAGGIAAAELRAWIIASGNLAGPLDADAVATLIAVTLGSAVFVALLLVPIVLLLRWAVVVQCERHDRSPFEWIRARSALAVLAVAALLGTGTLYSADVQAALYTTHETLQARREAPGRPAWLPGMEAGAYTVQWNGDLGFPKVDRIAFEALPIAPVIVVRFADGQELVCRGRVCTPGLR